jgi:hypothetical protein
MAKYPTKEEILASEPKFHEEMLWCVKEWSLLLKGWKNMDNAKKMLSLEFLIYTICPFYKKEMPKIKWTTEYKYNLRTKTMYLNIDNPSIISTLHELGHHLHGASELKACQWSVHLFKGAFPKSYAKLKWKGHLLVKE